MNSTTLADFLRTYIEGAVANTGATWLLAYADPLLDSIAAGSNPYSTLSYGIRLTFNPQTSPEFLRQIYSLIAFSIVVIVIILLGLILKITQGQFWLIHRLDSRVSVPHVSLCFGICSLIYGGVYIYRLVAAYVVIAKGHGWHAQNVFLDAGLPLILFVGQYCEISTTYSSYYIRRYGSHNSDTRLVSFGYNLLPFVFPIVTLVPCLVLLFMSSLKFGEAIRLLAETREALDTAASTWTADGTISLSVLISIVPVLNGAIVEIVCFAVQSLRANVLIGSVLGTALLIYIVGTIIEVRHLRAYATTLRRQAPLCRTQRHLRRSPRQKAVLTIVSESEDAEPVRGSVTPALESSGLNHEEEVTLEQHARLISWAATNRMITATMIAVTMGIDTGLSFWYAMKPASVTEVNYRFQIMVLASGWANTVLLVVVNLFILSRSLDRSRGFAKRLIKIFPWLPLPPPVGLQAGELTMTQVLPASVGVSVQHVLKVDCTTISNEHYDSITTLDYTHVFGWDMDKPVLGIPTLSSAFEKPSVLQWKP